MFVIKFLGVSAIVYLIITIAVPSAIGAYYGAILWKKYAAFYGIVPKETVDEWFNFDVRLHIANHPYMRFLSMF